MGLYLGYPGKFVVGYVRFHIEECSSATQRVLCEACPFRVYTRLHTDFVDRLVAAVGRRHRAVLQQQLWLRVSRWKNNGGRNVG